MSIRRKNPKLKYCNYKYKGFVYNGYCDGFHLFNKELSTCEHLHMSVTEQDMIDGTWKTLIDFERTR